MGINASTIQKLYIAYFNRPADVAGLTYWEGQLDANLISLPDLAQSFSQQAEYKTTYGGKSTSDVVAALYQNLFQRLPDAAGLKYWVGQIDGGVVNVGTAALAIVNGATPQSMDGATIQNKLNFAAGFTASLDTQVKANSYSTSYNFAVMRAILSTVNGTDPLPTLAPTVPVKVLDAGNGISLAKQSAGVDVVVDLKGVQTSVGYQVELTNGNNSFSIPVKHFLSYDEALAHKVVMHVPAGLNWGADGMKTLGVKVSDLFGNTGAIGAQAQILLKATPPSLPYNSSYATWWIKQASGSLDYVLGEIQYLIVPGENTGGSASLVENGTVVAKIANINADDRMLDFVIDPQLAKQVYNDYYTNKNLSLVITDALGNSVSTKLSDYQIHAEYKEKDGIPATNISISSGGGNLTVTAAINGLDYFLSKAYLKINGQVVAVSDSINSNDTTVSFNLYKLGSPQLQSLVNNGGLVSVTMVDHNGKMVDSTSNTTLPPNQFGSLATLDSTLNLPVLPSKGLYLTSYNDYTFLSMNEIRYSIVSGQNIGGSATLVENGTVLASIPSINANDTTLDFVIDPKIGRQVYNDFYTNKNLSLVITNASGYSVVSKLSDYKIGYESRYKDGTPATNIKLVPVGGNVVANSLNSSNTDLLVSASIVGSDYFDHPAYLKINGKIVASHQHISTSDTTINFDLGTSSNAELQNIVKNGGVVSILMVDMNGNSIESVVNPYLMTNFTSAFAANDSKVNVTHDHVTSTSHTTLVNLVGQPPHLQHMDMVTL